MSNDRPDAPDRIIARSRARRGDPPAELGDPSNYLVFDRLPSAGALDDPIGAFGRRGDGRVAALDVLGIVVEAVQPVTPETVAAELEDLRRADGDIGRDSSAHIPSWTAVSPAPTLASPAEPPLLVRRNGTRVRGEWVIPPDGRAPYYPNTYPFSVVGKLFVWPDASALGRKREATASLLGSRTILTASHAVPWDSSNWKALFVPAYYDGNSVFGPSAVSWVTKARGYSDHAQGDDMAVMRLDVPLGDSLGYFGFRTYDDAWEDMNVWTLPGYPFDKDDGQRPWLHRNFPIIDDDSDGAGVELEYQADTERGQSGAPVYAWFNGSPEVVGTHSGAEDNLGEPRQNVAAGGSALTNLLHWARATWP